MTMQHVLLLESALIVSPMRLDDCQTKSWRRSHCSLLEQWEWSQKQKQKQMGNKTRQNQ